MLRRPTCFKCVPGRLYGANRHTTLGHTGGTNQHLSSRQSHVLPKEASFTSSTKKRLNLTSSVADVPRTDIHQRKNTYSFSELAVPPPCQSQGCGIAWGLGPPAGRVAHTVSVNLFP